MKKFIWLGVFCLLFVVGCSMASKSMEYYRSCVNDAGCMAEMERSKNITSIVVERGVDNFPFGNAGKAVGSLAGSIVSFFVGVWRGKKLCESKA